MIRPGHPDSHFFSTRWTNPAAFEPYGALLNHPERFDSITECISADDARFETVMLSLRMTRGLNRARFRELHGDCPEFWYGDVLSRLRDQGLLVFSDDCWRLTRRGMDIQNSVLLEFME